MLVMGRVLYCEKGHLVGLTNTMRAHRGMIATRWVRSGGGSFLSELPEFCLECGSPTSQVCAQCNTPIAFRGKDCGKCGKAHPWTETALAAAKEYADEIDELSTEDKIALKGTFDDLTVETPRTQLALSRFTKLAKKMGPPALETLQKILVDIVAETVKKTLFPK